MNRRNDHDGDLGHHDLGHHDLGHHDLGHDDGFVLDDDAGEDQWAAPRLRAVGSPMVLDDEDDPAFASAGEHESVGLLRAAIDLITSAPRLPLSSTVRVEPDEVLDLLEAAVDRLPDELRQAKWLLKEREEFLAKVQREADDLLDEARARAERMVQRTEIARQARLTAQHTVDDAEAESRRMRHETEDYIDQKLAQFEIVVGRVMAQVQRGRDKMRITPLPEGRPGDVGHFAEDDATATFFDQDDSGFDLER